MAIPRLPFVVVLCGLIGVWLSGCDARARRRSGLSEKTISSKGEEVLEFDPLLSDEPCLFEMQTMCEYVLGLSSVLSAAFPAVDLAKFSSKESGPLNGRALTLAFLVSPRPFNALKLEGCSGKVALQPARKLPTVISRPGSSETSTLKSSVDIDIYGFIRYVKGNGDEYTAGAPGSAKVVVTLRNFFHEPRSATIQWEPTFIQNGQVLPVGEDLPPSVEEDDVTVRFVPSSQGLGLRECEQCHAVVADKIAKVIAESGGKLTFEELRSKCKDFKEESCPQGRAGERRLFVSFANEVLTSLVPLEAIFVPTTPVRNSQVSASLAKIREDLNGPLRIAGGFNKDRSGTNDPLCSGSYVPRVVRDEELAKVSLKSVTDTTFFSLLSELRVQIFRVFYKAASESIFERAKQAGVDLKVLDNEMPTVLGTAIELKLHQQLLPVGSGGKYGFMREALHQCVLDQLVLRPYKNSAVLVMEPAGLGVMRSTLLEPLPQTLSKKQCLSAQFFFTIPEERDKDFDAECQALWRSALQQFRKKNHPLSTMFNSEKDDSFYLKHFAPDSLLHQLVAFDLVLESILETLRSDLASIQTWKRTPFEFMQMISDSVRRIDDALVSVGLSASADSLSATLSYAIMKLAQSLEADVWEHLSAYQLIMEEVMTSVPLATRSRGSWSTGLAAYYWDSFFLFARAIANLSAELAESS